MRVLLITSTRRDGYGAVIRSTVSQALDRAGVTFDVCPVGEDVRDRAGYDVYLGTGDEILWRNPQVVAAIRAMGGRSADLRARYMNPRATYLWRRYTDHRGRGPDWVFTHLRTRHPRGHYVGQCVDETRLYPEQDDRLTVFIDHYMPRRRSVLGDILDQCARLHRRRPELRFWYMSADGIVENDFTETRGSYRTYPFDEIARYYRRTHIVLPTHRETQGMLAAEIGMCGGLTLLRPWMYPAERRAEVPHRIYRRRIVLPETVDIAANRAHAQAHFSIDAFAARLKAGLDKVAGGTRPWP